MNIGVSKICVVCGLDVASQPRTKDTAGNYYCQPCYDNGGRVSKNAGIDEDDSLSKPAEPSPVVNSKDLSFPCPSCGGIIPLPLMHESGVCRRCATTSRPSRPQSSAKGSAKLKIGIVASVLVILGVIVLLFSKSTELGRDGGRATASAEIRSPAQMTNPTEPKTSPADKPDSSQHTTTTPPPVLSRSTEPIAGNRGTPTAPEQKLISQRNFIYTFAADPPRRLELLADGKFGVGPGGGQVGGGPTSFEQRWTAMADGIVISGAHGDFRLMAGMDGVMRGRIADLGFDVSLAPDSASVTSSDTVSVAVTASPTTYEKGVVHVVIVSWAMRYREYNTFKALAASEERLYNSTLKQQSSSGNVNQSAIMAHLQKAQQAMQDADDANVRLQDAYQKLNSYGDTQIKAAARQLLEDPREEPSLKAFYQILLTQ